MILSNVRLYTWVDVEEVLLRAQQKGDWPEWLVWTRAYWDGLTFGIRPGKREAAIAWLAEVFDPRFDKKTASIVLESVQERPRRLEVLFEETKEGPESPRFIPTLARPAVLWPFREREHPSSLPSDLPPVIAFHSFKGGVGRTIHALALARALAEQKSRVLLVDGDLEAPGLTWLLRTRLPDPLVSFVDFLALVHGDPDPSATNSIELVANRLRTVLLDGIYALPAFRSVTQFTSLEVRPEHLIQGAEDPFILTTILAKLGKSLNAGAVIVDLRAGLSEISAGLLLDPRVYRVLVTTLSGQSMQGTCQLLELLGRLAPSKKEEEPLPALIIAQVPEDYQKQNLLVNPIEQLLTAASPFWESRAGGDEGEPDLPLVTRFDSSLIVLPDAWDEVIKRLSSLVDQIAALIDWLPAISSKDFEAEVLQIDIQEIQHRRRELADFTERLTYAETGDIKEFLTIRPLRHLASDFSTNVPIAVIVGAKGAGKTYTFLQTVRRRTWQTFAQDAGIAEVSIEAFVCPVLKSKNLQEMANKIVQDTRQKTAEMLGLSIPHDTQSILDYLWDSLKEGFHEGQWRERWLNVIAWSAGFEVGKDGAGRRFTDYLCEKKQHVVAVIDGLEDLFQDLSSKESEQTALRALLQDVPEWLEQQPYRPLGLLAFVRQDMVLNAVRQNPAQLMARYEPYALRWSSEEALRLVAWISVKAGAPIRLSIEQLQKMSKPDLVNALVPLWGRKLGHESSREAPSAEWVIPALSDLKGQIQAWDLARFLYKAAEASVNDTYWQNRLLVPKAIRGALRECSGGKIEEIGIENTALKNVFSRLRDLPDDSKQIPFAREQVNLKIEELQTLEDNGVVLREGEEYYMPEIFRLGLGFRLRAGKRPRVLTLVRRA